MRPPRLLRALACEGGCRGSSPIRLFSCSTIPIYIVHTFDYCDVALHKCTKSESDTLDRLPNYTAWVILHQQQCHSATEGRKELSLATLPLRCKLHLVQHVYKAVHGIHSLSFNSSLPWPTPFTTTAWDMPLLGASSSPAKINFSKKFQRLLAVEYPPYWSPLGPLP